MQFLFLFLFAGLFLTSCQTIGFHSPSGHIPDPMTKPYGASDFLRVTQNYNPSDRDKFILKLLRQGHVPSFVHELEPVHIKETIDGRVWSATIYVVPDYLALGHDDDWLRIPMTPMAAQLIADYYGFLLPTTKMVDLIYRQAGRKLTPKPLPPGKYMTSNLYYKRHQDFIQKSLGSEMPSELVAGHKKDIVITNRLLTKRRRVAIYGWHRPTGKPIQPLSLVHGDSYADYSHGVRLISHTAKLNGVYVPIVDILTHPKASRLLSYEGPLRRPRLAVDHYVYP